MNDTYAVRWTSRDPESPNYITFCAQFDNQYQMLELCKELMTADTDQIRDISAHRCHQDAWDDITATVYASLLVARV